MPVGSLYSPERPDSEAFRRHSEKYTPSIDGPNEPAAGREKASTVQSAIPRLRGEGKVIAVLVNPKKMTVVAARVLQ